MSEDHNDANIYTWLWQIYTQLIINMYHRYIFTHELAVDF